MFYDIHLHQSHLTRIINFQTREKCLRENLTPNKNSFEELAKCSETQLNPPHPYPTILGINAGQLLMTTRSYYLSRKEKSPIPPNIIINNRFRNTRNTIVSLWREISDRNEKRRQIYILCIMFLVRPQHWQCYQRGLRGRWSEELMNAFWSMSVCMCLYNRAECKRPYRSTISMTERIYSYFIYHHHHCHHHSHDHYNSRYYQYKDKQLWISTMRPMP